MANTTTSATTTGAAKGSTFKTVAGNLVGGILEGTARGLGVSDGGIGQAIKNATTPRQSYVSSQPTTQTPMPSSMRMMVQEQIKLPPPEEIEQATRDLENEPKLPEDGSINTAYNKLHDHVQEGFVAITDVIQHNFHLVEQRLTEQSRAINVLGTEQQRTKRSLEDLEQRFGRFERGGLQSRSNSPFKFGSGVGEPRTITGNGGLSALEMLEGIGEAALNRWVGSKLLPILKNALPGLAVLGTMGALGGLGLWLDRRDGVQNNPRNDPFGRKYKQRLHDSLDEQYGNKPPSGPNTPFANPGWGDLGKDFPSVQEYNSRRSSLQSHNRRRDALGLSGGPLSGNIDDRRGQAPYTGSGEGGGKPVFFQGGPPNEKGPIQLNADQAIISGKTTEIKSDRTEIKGSTLTISADKVKLSDSAKRSLLEQLGLNNLHMPSAASIFSGMSGGATSAVGGLSSFGNKVSGGLTGDIMSDQVDPQKSSGSGFYGIAGKAFNTLGKAISAGIGGGMTNSPNHAIGGGMAMMRRPDQPYGMVQAPGSSGVWRQGSGSGGGMWSGNGWSPGGGGNAVGGGSRIGNRPGGGGGGGYNPSGTALPYVQRESDPYSGIGERFNFAGSDRARQMGMNMQPGQVQTFETGIVDGKGPGTIQSNQYAGRDIAGFLHDLHEAGAPLDQYSGTYAKRQIRGGSGWSQHAYGNAVDIETGFGHGPDNSPKLFAWAQKNPEKWAELQSKYHMKNLAPNDWGHLEWTPAGRNPNYKPGSDKIATQRPDGTPNNPTAQGSSGGKIPDGAYNPRLAQARAGYMQELENNPAFKKEVGRLVRTENWHDGQGPFEAMVNRAQMHGASSLYREVHPVGGDQVSFYGPIRHGTVRQLNDEQLQEAYRDIGEVGKGSNILDYRTDQGMYNPQKGINEHKPAEQAGLGYTIKNIRGEFYSEMGKEGHTYAEQQRQLDAQYNPPQQTQPTQTQQDPSKPYPAGKTTPVPIGQPPQAGMNSDVPLNLNPGSPVPHAGMNPNISPFKGITPGASQAHGTDNKDYGRERLRVVDNAARLGVNPAIIASAREASKYLPEGYSVEAYSGRREGAGQSQHGRGPQGSAIDFVIRDKNGQPVNMQPGREMTTGYGNYQYPPNFRVYEKFAQDSHKAMAQIAPQLAQQHRWGGYFGGPLDYPRVGNSGHMDLMHQDLGGGDAVMAAGKWASGITPEAAKMWGVKDSQGMGDIRNYQMGNGPVPPEQGSPPAPAQGGTPPLPNTTAPEKGPIQDYYKSGDPTKDSAAKKGWEPSPSPMPDWYKNQAPDTAKDYNKRRDAWRDARTPPPGDIGPPAMPGKYSGKNAEGQQGTPILNQDSKYAGANKFGGKPPARDIPAPSKETLSGPVTNPSGSAPEGWHKVDSTQHENVKQKWADVDKGASDGKSGANKVKPHGGANVRDRATHTSGKPKQTPQGGGKKETSGGHQQHGSKHPSTGGRGSAPGNINGAPANNPESAGATPGSDGIGVEKVNGDYASGGLCMV